MSNIVVGNVPFIGFAFDFLSDNTVVTNFVIDLTEGLVGFTFDGTSIFIPEVKHATGVNQVLMNGVDISNGASISKGVLTLTNFSTALTQPVGSNNHVGGNLLFG
jgi:hypothetical protein